MSDPIRQFIDWYSSRPIVTKVWMTLSTLMAVSISLGIISVMDIFYIFSNTFPTFQLWRPFTSLLFISQLDLFFAAKAYIVYSSLYHAQQETFKKANRVDFWVLITYIIFMLTIFGAIMDVYILIDGLVMALIYVWAKYKPFGSIVLIFQISIPSNVFPWIYLGFAVLLGVSFYVALAGLLIGCLYVYLKGPFLHKYNIDLIKTPGFLKIIAKTYYQRINRQSIRRYQQQNQQVNQDEEAHFQ